MNTDIYKNHPFSPNSGRPNSDFSGAAMQTEVELLDNTQIIQLQKLLKTDKFVEFMRPNKGICNPRGRTIVEIWTWVSRELGLTKEQFESFANLRDFEMGLYDMEIINLKKTDTGYLWFHNSWY